MNDRLPKKMLLARTEEGQRERSRPKKSWADVVGDNFIQIREGWWYQSRQDRAILLCKAGATWVGWKTPCFVLCCVGPAWKRCRRTQEASSEV
jgi:hypothetical protein